jgi:hypothetical protein
MFRQNLYKNLVNANAQIKANLKISFPYFVYYTTIIQYSKTLEMQREDTVV